MYSAEVGVHEGQHINRMPFTAEWWPAQHLMASLTQNFKRPIPPLARIKMHRGGERRKNNSVSSHACGIKKKKKQREGRFVLLSFSNAQVFWQTTQSVRVRACVPGVRVCVYVRALLCFSLHLYCPPLNCPWSAKRTASSKKPDTSKQSMFAKFLTKCSRGTRWL